MSLPVKTRKRRRKPRLEQKPVKQRRFKIGHITRIFDLHEKYTGFQHNNKSRAEEEAEKLKAQRFYTRISKVKHMAMHYGNARSQNGSDKMSLPIKRRGKSRATKKQRVDVTREVIEAARLMDGPEIDSVVLSTHRALDDGDWREASSNLACMIGYFKDPKMDTALRLNMVLLDELEAAEADGKITAKEKKKVEKVRKSVDTFQERLLEEKPLTAKEKQHAEKLGISEEEYRENKRKLAEYYAGSVSGVGIRRLREKEVEEDRFEEIRAKRKALENAREKVVAGGPLEHVKEMQQRIEEKGGITRIVDTGKDTITTPKYRIYDLIQTFSAEEWKKMQDSELKWQQEEERQSREWVPAKKAEFPTTSMGHQTFSFLGEYNSRKEAEEALIEKIGPQKFGKEADYQIRIDERRRGDYPVYLAYYYKFTPLQMKARQMDYPDQIKVIRKWIKKHVPTLSVRRGTGTAYSYIDIMALHPKGRSFTEKELEGLRNLGRHPGGNFDVIGPEDRDFWTVKALKDLARKKKKRRK